MAKQTIPNSGLWSTIASLINGNYTELYSSIGHGVYIYEDTATHTTPFSLPGTSTFTDIPNDALGSSTSESYGVTGVTGVYGSGDFDFSGFEIGDILVFTPDFSVTTSTSNQEGCVQLLMGVGSASEKGYLTLCGQPKAAGTYPFYGTAIVPLLNSDFLNYPAKVQMYSDASADVVVNTWTIFVMKRTHTV